MLMRQLVLLLIIFTSGQAYAAKTSATIQSPLLGVKNIEPISLSAETEASPFIDVPVTYNKEVRKWVKYFQTRGKRWFTKWLSRSHKYLPRMQHKLELAGMPKDLAYISMIESGFSSKAVSTASAVGPWQFIEPTGKRFGLKIANWIDERRDFEKSTDAAISYMKILHKEFGSWYLVAAAYNTGEGRVRRYIRRYKTKDFWTLSKKKAFVEETRDYIPKFLAAVLIAKAPQLYGFRNVKPQYQLRTEYFMVPGGTKLKTIADHLKITHRAIKEMNPDLTLGYIPHSVSAHLIRVPEGATKSLAPLLAKNP